MVRVGSEYISSFPICKFWRIKDSEVKSMSLGKPWLLRVFVNESVVLSVNRIPSVGQHDCSIRTCQWYISVGNEIHDILADDASLLQATFNGQKVCWGDGSSKLTECFTLSSTVTLSVNFGVVLYKYRRFFKIVCRRPRTIPLLCLSVRPSVCCSRGQRV